MNLKLALFVALGTVSGWFLWSWWRLVRRGKGVFADDPARARNGYHALVGFVMCFFDTLGIGNFATTTSAFKFRSSMLDEKIPGTLNVGYALPTAVQAYIYIAIVKVDLWTLVLMISASVLGAWLGAGVVARWPRRSIQLGMGAALLAAAGLMLRAQLAAGGAGDGSLALGGSLLALGLAGNFVLGALMTLGIGLYAPCLVLVSLLGMNPSAAFPIMMGSCAFLMPTAGFRFVKAGSYSLPAAVALTLSGIPAVLIAAFIVRSLPLTQVRWLVIVVVMYAATMMLRSALAGRQAAPGPVAAEAAPATD